MNSKVIDAFRKLIDVNTPIIYINDYDFVRVDEIISEVIGNKKVFEWNPATCTTDFITKTSKGGLSEQTLESFLEAKYDEEVTTKEKYLVLKEIQDYIDEPKIKTLLALMSQRKLYDREYETTVIIVSSVIKVPQEIEKYVSYLEIDFPDEEEINKEIQEDLRKKSDGMQTFCEEYYGFRYTDREYHVKDESCFARLFFEDENGENIMLDLERDQYGTVYTWNRTF